MMDDAAFVQCPICRASIVEVEINRHLDRCIGECSAPKRQRTSCSSSQNDALQTLPVTIDDEAPTLIQQTQAPEPCSDARPSSSQEVDATQASPHSARIQDDKTAEFRSQEGDADDRGSASVTAVLQPADYLLAQLLGSRAHALRCARDDSTRLHCRVTELCALTNEEIHSHKADLEEYPKLSKPTDYDQQVERNKRRDELSAVIDMVQQNLRSMLSSMHEPQSAIVKAEDAQLHKIDSVITMLQELREQTVQEFKRCKKEDDDRLEHSRVCAADLAKSLVCLDEFATCLAEEVKEETSAAIQKNAQKLEELKKEEMRYVQANDSPQRNPLFAKVIDDITATRDLLQDHHDQGKACQDLVLGWGKVYEEMPKPTVQPQKPPRRSLLDRMLRRS